MICKRHWNLASRDKRAWGLRRISGTLHAKIFGIQCLGTWDVWFLGTRDMKCPYTLCLRSVLLAETSIKSLYT